MSAEGFDVFSAAASLGKTPDTAGSTALQCSRKGCRSSAAHALLWNNPTVHAPERRKVWLACAEHRDFLADFLSARGFLKDVRASDDIPESAG